jgi:hypothetical protein
MRVRASREDACGEINKCCSRFAGGGGHATPLIHLYAIVPWSCWLVLRSERSSKQRQRLVAQTPFISGGALHSTHALRCAHLMPAGALVMFATLDLNSVKILFPKELSASPF